MPLSFQTALHFRAIYNGGNWTAVNLKDVLKDITWEQANTKVQNFNTITTLVYHTSYYVSTLIKVLEDGPLDAKDELSFFHPPVTSQGDWENLLVKVFTEAEKAVQLIEQLPEEKFFEVFSNEKYGNYFRNIYGIVEHLHYHLGQMVILKKMI